MKEAKILIGCLPVLYVALSYFFWIQDFKILSCVMLFLSVVFGLLLVGIITNSERG